MKFKVNCPFKLICQRSLALTLKWLHLSTQAITGSAGCQLAYFYVYTMGAVSCGKGNVNHCTWIQNLINRLQLQKKVKGNGGRSIYHFALQWWCYHVNRWNTAGVGTAKLLFLLKSKRDRGTDIVFLNWGKDTLLLEISLFWQILTLTGGKNSKRLGDAVRQWAKKRTVNSKGAAGLADSSLYACINVCATNKIWVV